MSTFLIFPEISLNSSDFRMILAMSTSLGVALQDIVPHRAICAAAMRCFCCTEAAEAEVVLPVARDPDDVAPISKAAIGSPTRKAKTFQVGMMDAPI